MQSCYLIREAVRSSQLSLFFFSYFLKSQCQIVLTIEDKVKIVEMLDKFVSYPVIAEKFGNGKSTIGDIKKNREKTLKFQCEYLTWG